MKYSIFGESHGPAIGVVLEGVPAGLELDLDTIRFDLSRRAPGKNARSTARKEADEPRILSGVFEGRTTGAPLCAVMENTDTRSKDYSQTRDLARPGADFLQVPVCPEPPSQTDSIRHQTPHRLPNPSPMFPQWLRKHNIQ